MSNEKYYTAKNPDYEYWHTATGNWFPGERIVLNGENVLSSMKGKSWMEIILLAITGQVPDPKTAAYLDAILALSGCIPDPRLWNNRIAALGGTVRSTPALAMSAGMAASDAVIFGFQPMMGAHHLFADVIRQLDSGKNLKDVLSQRLAMAHQGRPGTGKNREIALLAGYGRPVAKGDERIPAIMEVVRQYGHDHGQAVTLAFAIEQHLEQQGLAFRLNSGGLIAAICADLGMTALQLYYYVSHCFYVSLAACNADALHHKIGSFFPLRCTQVMYEGPPERKWQRR